jgi:septal ring factor EnvC (AmiA/AmiB activator)
MRKVSIALTLLFALITTVSAQERRPVLVDDIRGERIRSLSHDVFPVDSLNLNNSQHSLITRLQTEMLQDLNRLNRQLHEKETELQTLETQPAASLRAINKNIDKQAKLLAGQMKLKARYKQKIRSLLDEEQRVIFDRKVTLKYSF